MSTEINVHAASFPTPHPDEVSLPDSVHLDWKRSEVELRADLTKLPSFPHAGPALLRLAWVFIYFSFFREQQCEELPSFDPASIREIFKDRLRNNRLRGTVTVHFTSLLLNKQIAFEDLVPYLELIVAGRLDKYVNNRFYQPAASQAATHPTDIGSMMETVMDGELQGLADGSFHEIWCPKDFARSIEALVKAGPEHQKRVAQLRQRMEPFRDRIHNLFDFKCLNSKKSWLPSGVKHLLTAQNTCS